MATPAKPTAPQIEGHIIFCKQYDTYYALPMSLASQILPVLKVVRRDGYGADAVWSLETKHDSEGFNTLDADTMTAIMVKARLTKE